MALTLRAVLQELDRLAGASQQRTIDDIGRDEIVASVARAALLGARGNSGVILSQLIRGAAEELASRPGELVDPVLISAALARAADQAYGSVRDPAEGTILTVVREMAVRVASDLAHMPTTPGSASKPTAEEQNAVIAEVIERALDAGQESVKRGPDLLPGAARGGRRRRRRLRAHGAAAPGSSARCGAPRRRRHRAPRRGPGHPSRSTPRPPTATARTSRSPARRSSGAGSSTRSSRSATRSWSSAIRPRSRSTSTPTTPTPPPRCSPSPARSRTSTSPTCASRSSERDARLAAPADTAAVCGALAVVTGDGMRSLFEGLGVRDARRRPDAEPLDLRPAGRRSTRSPPSRSWCCPNSPNVVMAAERAAELSEKTVVVVLSRSPQAGLAAAVSLDPDRGAAANADGDDRHARAGPHRRRRRPPRATTCRGGSARATRSASSRSRSSPGAGPGDDAARGARAAGRERGADHLPARGRGAARRRDG